MMRITKVTVTRILLLRGKERYPLVTNVVCISCEICDNSFYYKLERKCIVNALQCFNNSLQIATQLHRILICVPIYTYNDFRHVRRGGKLTRTTA